MKFLKLVLFFSIDVLRFSETVAVDTSSDGKVEGYYWRDFTGDIPVDAVPGGRDKTGEPTYIGQTVHTTCDLIPGQIDAQRKLFYHHGALGYAVVRKIKVLCSPYPEQFEWIETNVVDMRFLTQRQLVPGGTSQDYPLLIGRASVDDQVVVGKVTIYHKYEGFAYAMLGKAGYQNNSYEVLSYNTRC